MVIARASAGHRDGRGDRVVRLLLAVPGGYLLATLAGIALARALPMARVDGVLLAMLAAFVLQALVIMRVFALRSTGRAVTEWGLAVVASATAAGLLA